MPSGSFHDCVKSFMDDDDDDDDDVVGVAVAVSVGVDVAGVESVSDILIFELFSS